jgi:hypothetical protein
MLSYIRVAVAARSVQLQFEQSPQLEEEPYRGEGSEWTCFFLPPEGFAAWKLRLPEVAVPPVGPPHADRAMLANLFGPRQNAQPGGSSVRLHLVNQVLLL